MAAIPESPQKLSSNEDLHLDTSTLRIRRILVPTDFSQPATRALEAAIAIAELYGSTLQLAHASFSANLIAAEEFPPQEFLIDRLEQDQKMMQTLIAAHPRLAKVQMETTVDYGDPITMIRRLAEKWNPDLLVLGSHGCSGLERIALGSLAESVAHDLTQPVLIMGPHAKSGREPFQSIVFATDLSSTGLRPAQYASSFAERFHSELLMLHIVEEAPQNERFRSEREQQALQDLEMLVPRDAKLACRPRFKVEFGKAAERIVQAARDVNATLVVVGARRAGPLTSHLPWLTVSKIIREAECGVLVVRNRFL